MNLNNYFLIDGSLILIGLPLLMILKEKKTDPLVTSQLKNISEAKT